MGQPSTLFPRTYIIERVEARMASIRSRRGGAAKMVKAIHRGQAAEIRAFAKAMVVHTEKMHEILDTFDAALRSKDVDPVVAKAEFHRAVNLLQKVESPTIYFFEDDGKPTFSHDGRWQRERMPENVRLAVEAYEAEQKDAIEYDALEHSLAYLKGTPVDAFSLTTLKQLGLLDAVKFDLGAAKSETKGSRR